ncbi:hypothetical protein QBC43DRAFT_289302 [Cladorrhinum sp. PSN259]|nr:hypothetical protein QBC43DRAFT_289302 [Cladorrhinum sp. PSN259]
MHASSEHRAAIALISICLLTLAGSTPVTPPSVPSPVGIKPTTNEKRGLGQEPTYCERNRAYSCGYTCYWIDWWDELNQNLIFRQCDAWVTNEAHDGGHECKYMSYCYNRPDGSRHCIGVAPEIFCANQHYDMKCDSYYMPRRRQKDMVTVEMEARDDASGGATAASDQSEGSYSSECWNHFRKAEAGSFPGPGEVGEVTAKEGKQASQEGNRSFEENVQVYVTFENGTQYAASPAEGRSLIQGQGKLEARASAHLNLMPNDCCRVYC